MNMGADSRKLDFQDGEIITCVYTSGTAYPLTKGKGYTVIGTSAVGVSVRVDDGRTQVFFKSRFKKLPKPNTLVNIMRSVTS